MGKLLFQDEKNYNEMDNKLVSPWGEFSVQAVQGLTIIKSLYVIICMPKFCLT